MGFDFSVLFLFVQIATRFRGVEITLAIISCVVIVINCEYFLNVTEMNVCHVVNLVAQCDISTTANSTVTIKCPLSSAPNSVIWMKSDHRVETDSLFTVHNENGSLHIDKVGELPYKF